MCSSDLSYAVNSIAMPMIGGTTSWVGPLVGAILLGTLQQIATVTISSAVNLLIVGLLLIGFVIVAPRGIVGLVQDISEKKRVEVDRREYVAKLEGALMHSVEVAMTLSELRDPYTAGHERRVAELAWIFHKGRSARS